jgi:hypothetical protein
MYICIYIYIYIYIPVCGRTGFVSTVLSTGARPLQSVRKEGRKVRKEGRKEGGEGRKVRKEDEQGR